VFRHVSTQSEVANLGVSMIQQEYIASCQVTMYDSLTRQVGHSVGYLQHQLEYRPHVRVPMATGIVIGLKLLQLR
jgi:hypothetical protein